MKQKRNFSVLLILSSLLAFGCIENSKIDSDLCPDDADKVEPGLCGCGIPDPETDQNGDGVIDISDCMDLCPDNPDKVVPGLCGCDLADPETDQNGDGKIDISDCMDLCPDNPDKVVPGLCGCDLADPETDQNGDGKIDLLDCIDLCPDNPDKMSPGVCGCDVLDTDSDGDTVPDCKDRCPEDAEKLDPGLCGCGVPDTDSDGDTVPDCKDQCPEDAEKLVPGACGCGVSDTDNDGDTVPDCNDACPLNPEAFLEKDCPLDANHKCVIGTYKCDGRMVLSCRNGVEWSDYKTCTEIAVCLIEDNYASCVAKYPSGACVAGSTQYPNGYHGCRNDSIVVCENGIITQTACADGERCVEGECVKDQMCDYLPSGTKYCTGGVLKQCENGVVKSIEDCKETGKYCHMEKLECVEPAFDMCTYNDYNVVDASKDGSESRTVCVNTTYSSSGRLVTCTQGSAISINDVRSCSVVNGYGYCLDNKCVPGKCMNGYHMEKNKNNEDECVADNYKKYTSISNILSDSELRPSESCADTPKTTGPVSIELAKVTSTAYLTDLSGMFLQDSTGGIFVECANRSNCARNYTSRWFKYLDKVTYINSDHCYLTIEKSSIASISGSSSGSLTVSEIAISEENLAPTSQYMNTLVKIKDLVTAKKYIGEEAGYDVPWGWEVETADGLTIMVVGIVNGVNDIAIKNSMEAGLKYELAGDGILTYWKGKVVFAPKDVDEIYEYCEASTCVADDETIVKSCDETTHRATTLKCMEQFLSSAHVASSTCKENKCVIVKCRPGFKLSEDGSKCESDMGESCKIDNAGTTVSLDSTAKTCIGQTLYTCYNGTATKTECTTTIENATATCDATALTCNVSCNSGYTKKTASDGSVTCEKTTT